MNKKEIQKRMQQLVDTADTEKRDMTDAETTEFDGLEVKLNAIDMAERQTKRSIPIPPAHHDGRSAVVHPFGRVGVSYRELYYPDGRLPADNRDIEQFYRDITEKRTMLSGVGAQGGFFVPEAHANMLMEEAFQMATVYQRVMQFPALAEGSTLNIGAFDSSNQSNGFFGGVSAQWKGEGDAFTAVTPAVRSMTMHLRKLGIFTDISREMAEDAQSIAAVLSRGLSMTLAQTLDEVILVGDGVAKPLGVRDAPCTIAVGRAVANQVAYADIVSMYARLHPACISRAVWVVSNEVLPELLTLQDPGNNYIWQPGTSGSVANAVPGGLLGCPLFVSDKVGELGEKGDVMLCDFSFYGWVTKKGISIETTNAARWSEDIMSYRAIVRATGMPLLHSAITPRNGGDTLSPFVVLSA